jgi:HD-like signal output (HDOD) protein
MVAERIFSLNGDDAFICGILHDFGLLVEGQTESEAFAAIVATCGTSSELLDLERRAFATDHCEIAALLTGDWHMATSIQTAIRDHHRLSDDLAPESLTGILQIAEYLAARLGHATLPGLQADIAPPLLAHLEENAEEYGVLIEDIPEEMARAEAIYG